MNDSPHRQTAADSSGRNGCIDWPSQLQRHGRWLRTVLLARSREPIAIDELLQEVALTAVRDGDSINDHSRIAPWLYQVAVRHALLHRRRLGRQRRVRNSFAERLDETAASGIDPLDPLAWLLADERTQQVRDSLDALPPREAELLLLKYSEDWSYRQIAEHVGLSESAVDARLHRARQRPRKELLRRNVVEVHS